MFTFWDAACSQCLKARGTMSLCLYVPCNLLNHGQALCRTEKAGTVQNCARELTDNDTSVLKSCLWHRDSIYYGSILDSMKDAIMTALWKI